MNVEIKDPRKAADAIRKLLNTKLPAESSAPKGPSGLPERPVNDTDTVNGEWNAHNLIDPGVINGVTGTGHGALISTG